MKIRRKLTGWKIVVVKLEDDEDVDDEDEKLEEKMRRRRGLYREKPIDEKRLAVYSPPTVSSVASRDIMDDSRQEMPISEANEDSV